jgi:hypothetical protein
VTQSKTLNLPADVQPPKQATYVCANCSPKAEALSKFDDFMKAQEKKWEAAGGEDVYKRKLARDRQRRRRAMPANRVKYNASQKELMRKKRAA